MNLLLALIAIVTMNQSPATVSTVEALEDGSGRAVITTDDGRTYNQGGRGAGTATQITWCLPSRVCGQVDGPSFRATIAPSAPVVSPFLYIGQ
jgi:hypothetical protein